MKDTEKDPEARHHLAEVVGALAQFGLKVEPDKAIEAVRAVLAQLRQEQAINAQLRRAHRSYVAACICGSATQ